MTKINEALWSLDHDALPEPIAAMAFPHGDYAYPKKLKRKRYEDRLEALQGELVRLQRHVRETGERIVCVFEGRDAAGKGGTIKRFTEHMNPRHARVVALSKPSDVERGQWYFQRYVAHLPTDGEIVFFDRSWYNRAGVERVMGFCRPDEVERFYEEAPRFEAALVRDGIRLFKFWLTVSRAEQLKRFYERKTDILKSWKLSPIDHASVGKWDEYTAAIADMLTHTHREATPWTVIDSNDQRRARLEAIKVVLTATDYAGKDADAIGALDDKILIDPQRLMSP